jgi:hypothetical protein
MAASAGRLPRSVGGGGEPLGCRPGPRPGLEGRGGRSGMHGGRVCSLDREHGAAELDLVLGPELDRAGDPLAVDEGAVRGAQVLDHHCAPVDGEAGVEPGDPGVVEDEVRPALLATERQLILEWVLAAGPRSVVDHQRGHAELAAQPVTGRIRRRRSLRMRRCLRSRRAVPTTIKSMTGVAARICAVGGSLPEVRAAADPDCFQTRL